MVSPLTVPPLPQTCFNFLDRSFISFSERTSFLTSVTVFPPRPLESRCRYTVCCEAGNDCPFGKDGCCWRKSPCSDDHTVLDSFFVIRNALIQELINEHNRMESLDTSALPDLHAARGTRRTNGRINVPG